MVPVMALLSVCANSGDTACSHGCCCQATCLPSRSVIEATGVGGHHMPSESSVAPTFASSSGLTGETPSVNEAMRCAGTSSW